MCGIFAIQTDRNAAEKTLTALKSLEYRGYDSWGVAWCEAPGQTKGNRPQTKEKKIRIQKHIGKIADVSDTYDLSSIVSSLSIGHTRWATHGGVTEANAHPHLDCSGRFALVHNGIVENFAELTNELINERHVFKSETDSEVIVHLIEEQIKDHRLKTKDAIRTVFKMLTGLNAIVILDRETETIIACKQGSPLVVGKNRVLASDAIALLPYTDEVHYMEDGEMVVLDRSSLKMFDTNTGEEKNFSWQPIERGNVHVDLGQNAHFMIKEIHEQRELVHRLQTIDYRLTKQAKRIFFVGCGSAFYACLYGEYLCSERGIDARAVVGSEFSHVIPLLGSKDTVIFLSQSGETIDLVETAKVLKDKAVTLVGLINREGSTLGRLCDRVIPLQAGIEQSVCATKSWLAKISVLSVLFAQTDLQPAVNAVDAILTPQYEHHYILPVANRIKDAADIFLIGRDKNLILALETAMKIKEITYIHAEAHAGGELKHGSIALIEAGTPVIVFAPQDASYDAIISNAMEVRARGAYVIGVADKPAACFDAWIPVEADLPIWPIVTIVPMQLLAYQMAVALGRDPDKPRNLAKSVTVK